MAGKRRQTQEEIIERRTEIAKLRLAGVRDQRVLASRLGVDQSTISRDFRAIDAEWKQQATEYTDEYKALQNERYEALIAAHWTKAMDGKGFDTDRVLAAMSQQAKLLGIDAPVKREDKLTVEYRTLVQEMAADAGLDVDEVMREVEAIVGGAA